MNHPKHAAASLKAFRAALSPWASQVNTVGNDPVGADSLEAFFENAPVDDLIDFVSEVQAMCTSPFYMVQGENPVSKALACLSTLRTSAIKKHLPGAIGALRNLDRQEILRVAETSHPSVMAFLIQVAEVGSKDFMRTDDKGREDLLGIELGL